MEHKIWGMYDTVDRIWYGDDFGPKLFVEDPKDPERAHFLARAGAQMVDVQLRQDPGRTRALEFPHDVALRLRDEVPTVMSALEAIRKIEAGTDLVTEKPEQKTFTQENGRWVSTGPAGTESSKKAKG